MTSTRTRLLLVAVIIGDSFLLPLSSDATDVARWKLGETGEWTTNTNDWQGATDTPLPSPGYPGTNHSVGIGYSSVSISSQDVSVAELYMSDGALLTITNGRTLTVSNEVNYRAADHLVGYVSVPNGTFNLQNSKTGIVYGLSFELGTSSTAGYLDLGSTWGATNGFRSDFGILDTVLIRLTNGGLRVDASNITMRSNTSILNYGQEMTFRGDWNNSDTTVVFMVQGKDTGTIDIAGNLSFGGCQLFETIDANGVNLIQVGGDAILTNAVLTVGCTDALTSPAASYDLVRVPAARTIYTNGMSFNVASNGGFKYTASLDLNRGGYDYLVITPGQFLPSVTITNPVDESFFTAVTNITISATATARSGTITKVEFYADANKVGEDTTAPYSVTWTNVYAGYYELKAIATDNNGSQGLSPSIGLNVQGTKVDGRKVFITGGAVITYDPGCAQ
mgnify:CR=1 FL=1